MLYYATTMCVYNIYTVIIIIHSTIQTKEKKTLSLLHFHGGTNGKRSVAGRRIGESNQLTEIGAELGLLHSLNLKNANIQVPHSERARVGGSGAVPCRRQGRRRSSPRRRRHGRTRRSLAPARRPCSVSSLSLSLTAFIAARWWLLR